MYAYWPIYNILYTILYTIYTGNLLVKLGIPPSPAISMKPTHKVNSTTRLSNTSNNNSNNNTNTPLHTPTLSNVTCANDPSQQPTATTNNSNGPSPMVKELHRNPSDIYSRSYTGIGIVKPRSYSYLTDEQSQQAGQQVVDKNSSLGSRNRRIPPVSNSTNNNNNNNSNNV